MINRQGFTLIEALFGCLILAVGAIVICGLVQQSMFSHTHGQEYELSNCLLNECLDKVTVNDIAELARQETIKGDFGDEYPDYSYVLEIKPEKNRDLYRVAATVTWNRNGLSYQTSVTTLIYDVGKRGK